MNLRCCVELAARYKARPQIARILSEDWCGRELYCPACDSDRIFKSKTNTPVVDFQCPSCEQVFQLKSSRSWHARKIVDAGYGSMIHAIRTDRAPHLLLLHYTDKWYVENLLLIPRMFFTESVIEKRKPLGPRARRAGWIGCNILLHHIPEDGKISIISDSTPAPRQKVRQEFDRVRRLAEVAPSLRGWTVEVLNLIRAIGRARFSLNDLYRGEQELKVAHPHNFNVRAKIRQQLQILRDLGILEFAGRGNYLLKA
jgi:type II restriction enzyme